MNVVNRDLFRLRSFKVEHSDDFAMCSHAIGAKIRRRTHEENADQIVEDDHQAGISPADVALLDEVRKLCCPAARLETGFKPEPLRAHGFTEAQVIEAVAMAALTNFLNTLQAGLGAVPDFPPRRVFGPKDLYRFPGRPVLPPMRLLPRIQMLRLSPEFKMETRMHSKNWCAGTPGKSSVRWQEL